MADSVHAHAAQFEGPHHPLYCYDIEQLGYHRDGSLTCPHSKIAAGPDLQMALDYSVALLIVELAGGWTPNPEPKPKAL